MLERCSGNLFSGLAVILLSFISYYCVGGGCTLANTQCFGKKTCASVLDET